MSTIEESPIHSDTINLELNSHMSDPGVKKIRRGRPKSKVDIEMPETIISPVAPPPIKTIIIPSAPKVIISSNRPQEKITQEVFSFSPEDETPPPPLS